ncbi:hypothetical protein HPB47_023785 [Ixodes persulcatus]|uniref:Uncharacterized protein n=1 Tax=Ixodes persulcatus TaxID=34615 RepID=A0AC60Q920_IXOPE|nr:hypothetical protein HPB47_023785 [Ixodes persulcatus]
MLCAGNSEDCHEAGHEHALALGLWNRLSWIQPSQRELERRTQPLEESLVEYIRVMQEVHNRAASAAPESERVAHIVRQAHPSSTVPSRTRLRHGPSGGLVLRGSRRREQPRPERSAPPDTVPEPFRGNTLEDRHPEEPVAVYNEGERRLLCPVCGVPEIHRPTHLAGALHPARVAADWARRAVPPPAAHPVAPHPFEVAEALRVFRLARPDLLRDRTTKRPPWTSTSKGGGGGRSEVSVEGLLPLLPRCKSGYAVASRRAVEKQYRASSSSAKTRLFAFCVSAYDMAVAYRSKRSIHSSKSSSGLPLKCDRGPYGHMKTAIGDCWLSVLIAGGGGSRLLQLGHHLEPLPSTKRASAPSTARALPSRTFIEQPAKGHLGSLAYWPEPPPNFKDSYGGSEEHVVLITIKPPGLSQPQRTVMPPDTNLCHDTSHS